jgi:hypothetical protein
VEVWRRMFPDPDLDPKTMHSGNKDLDDHELTITPDLISLPEQFRQWFKKVIKGVCLMNLIL